MELKQLPDPPARTHPFGDERSDLQAILFAKDMLWLAGDTSVSDFAPEVKSRMCCGRTKAPRPDPELFNREVITANTKLMFPETFDWRNKDGKNYVTPVKHQGSCGSCWAFSAVATMESAIMIAKGTVTDLSEQHLVSQCCDAGGCGGGWPDEAMKYMRDFGIPPESCFPYRGRYSQCEPCDNWEELAWMVESIKYVNNTTEAFKYALMTHGPLSCVLTAPDDWFYYRGGVYEPMHDGGVGWANHAVLLIGWNDTGKYWIVKNSWGAGWGEVGYAKVKFGVLEAYNYAYAITAIKDNGAAPGEWVSPIRADASSEYGTRNKYPAMNAIDEQEGTSWFSRITGDSNPWIIYDLGEVLKFDGLRIETFEKDLPIDIGFATAIEEGDVFKPSIGRCLTEQVSTIAVVPESARYIRIRYSPLTRAYGTCTDFKVRVAKAENMLDHVIVTHADGHKLSITDKFKRVVYKKGDTTVFEYNNV